MILEQRIQKAFLGYKSEVKRRAVGALKHDYLVPAGPYEEQWDWDAFFIGMSLASEIPSEGVYLKNWALNYLEYTNPRTGFTPGLLTPKGRDNRLHHIKPFFAQGILFACRFLGEHEWVRPHFATLQKSILYREQRLWSRQYGLGMWYDSMESGADNNVAALEYPKGSVIAADFNAFMYREYLALSNIAALLGKRAVAARFRTKAATLKRNINRYLWDARDQSYYNMDSRTGELIRRCTYSNIIPLFAGIAPRASGRAMIRRYVLNPRKLWARYGVRTLAADDVQYNNANIIKPHSNWQGPVWPIVNYLTMTALLNYGFRHEAMQVAEKMMKLCVADIERSGGMHENYHADTGRALAAPNFVSWNLLVGRMAEQARTGRSPFTI